MTILGVRQICHYVVCIFGIRRGQKRVRRLMRLMGLLAVYQKSKTGVLNQDIPTCRAV